MRQKVTKIIRNVLRERAITVIGALSPCAIYPRNNVKRDMIPVILRSSNTILMIFVTFCRISSHKVFECCILGSVEVSELRVSGDKDEDVPLAFPRRIDENSWSSKMRNN